MEALKEEETIAQETELSVKCQLHRRINLKAVSSLVALLRLVARLKKEEIAAD
jgi:hypothetical protein